MQGDMQLPHSPSTKHLEHPDRKDAPRVDCRVNTSCEIAPARLRKQPAVHMSRQANISSRLLAPSIAPLCLFIFGCGTLLQSLLRVALKTISRFLSCIGPHQPQPRPHHLGPPVGRGAEDGRA
jgi:hypothetical protein